MTAVSLVIGLVFWIALYFSRKRIVVLKRSSGTDQVTFELSRIADALERIANRPADRAIARGDATSSDTTASTTRVERHRAFYVWALERRPAVILNWTVMMGHRIVGCLTVSAIGHGAAGRSKHR